MLENPEIQTTPVQIEELSEKELKWGYWFLTHKDQIHKTVVGVLIAISVFCFGFSIYLAIQFFVIERDDYLRALQVDNNQSINVFSVHQAEQVIPLEIVSRQMIPGKGNKIDIVARVHNPNAKWALVSFAYAFTVGSKTYPEALDYLLPGEEKYLMLLNVEGIAAGTPQILTGKEQWQRVVQYKEWGPERHKFLIKSKQFISSREGGIADQISLSEAQTEIVNQSAYNFQQVKVQFALYSGSSLVAVNLIPIEHFLSGQSHSVSARWAQALPTITSVEIIPTVNILDPKAYQDFAGEFDPAFRELKTR